MVKHIEKECKIYKTRDSCEENSCSWDTEEKKCTDKSYWWLLLLLLPIPFLLMKSSKCGKADLIVISKQPKDTKIILTMPDGTMIGPAKSIKMSDLLKLEGIEEVPLGEYIIQASSDGCSSQTYKVKVEQCKVTLLEISLLCF